MFSNSNSVNYYISFNIKKKKIEKMYKRRKSRGIDSLCVIYWL